jgi:hypothetical protein
VSLEGQLKAFKERNAGVLTGGGSEKKQDKGFFDNLSNLAEMANPVNLVGGLSKLGWELGSDAMSMAQLPSGVLDAGLERAGAPQWLRSGAALTNPVNYPGMVRDEIQGENALDEFKALARPRDTVLVNDKGEKVGILTGPKDFRGQVGNAIGDVMPTYSEVAIEGPARSVGNVAKTVGGTITGNPGDTPYAKAYREGELPSVLIGDVGNLAVGGELLGGATSRAARAATRAEGAVKAASPIERAAAEAAAAPSKVQEVLAPRAPMLRAADETLGGGTALANRIAGAPLTVPLRAGREVLAPLAGREGYALSGILPSSERFAGAVDAVQTGIRDYTAARQAQGAMQSGAASLGRDDVARVAESFKAAADSLTPAEHQAIYVARTGLGEQSWLDLDQAVRAGQDAGQQSLLGVDTITGQPREVMDVLKAWDEAKRAETPTPDQADLLNRLGKASDDLTAAEDIANVRRLNNEGERTLLPADNTRGQQVFGDEPIEPFVQRQLERDPEYVAARSEASAAQPPAQPSLFDDATRPNVAAEARLAEKERLARENPRNYPTEWRLAKQMRDEGATKATQLADELDAAGLADEAAEIRRAAEAMPSTIDDMLEAGWQRPEHVRAGRFDDEGLLPSESKGRPRLRRGIFERERKGTDVDFDPKVQTRRLIADLHRQNLNIAVRQGLERVAESRPAVLDDILAAADSPRAVAAEMRRAGYEPVDRRTLDRQKADAVDVQGDGTAWVPKATVDGMEAAFNVVDGPESKALQAYDKGMSLWKAGVLPLNPRWLVGNVVGNTLLAAATLGVRDVLNPNLWSETRRALRNPDDRTLGLLGRGASEAELGKLLGDESVPGEAVTGVKGRAGQAVGGILRKSYRANQAIDDFTHVLIYTAKKNEAKRYLADLDGMLAKGEITPERHAALSKPPEKIRSGGPKAWTDEQAAAEALKYAGDFMNMSKVERNVVRRAMPFFSWARHITQLVGRLPLENPYRVAWTMKITDMFSDDDELPDWLRGAIPLGDESFLRIPGNPYGGVAGDENPFFNPAQMLSSLTPAVQVPLGAFNISGRGPVNPSMDKPGFIGADSLQGYLTNQIPLIRTAADTVQGPEARYMDRTPVTSRGRSVENDLLGGRWAAPVQYFTGMSVAQPDLAEEARKKLKKDREAQRQARR